jgi:protein pelota
MRILHRDLRIGEVKLLIQTQDDIWHLYNVVEPGDKVYSTTFRREEKIDGKLRAERMEKKKVRLGVRVEEVKFQEFTDKLRIHGKIEEGEDAGQYHTFNIGIEDELSIVKENGWKKFELDRLEEAVASSYLPVISFVALEYDEALLAQMYQYGVKEIATIRSRASGKQFPSKDKQEDFYQEIMDKLNLMELGDAIIIVGPGFAKDDFRKYLNEKSFRKKMHVYSSSQGGMLGIHEVLRSGIAKVLEEQRVVFETQLVEDVLSEIAKDGLFSYGPNEVERALELGAVDKLVILTDYMRDPKFETILELADKKRARIITVSPHHAAGKKLKNLGGVAALLRYKI